VDLLGQNESLLGWNGFDSVYPGSILAQVILRHPAYREEAGGSGFREQLLKFVDGLGIAMLTGSKDARIASLYTCCSNLRQGSLRHLSLAGAGSCLLLGAFVSDIRLVPLSSRSSSPRLHIPWRALWRWLLGESYSTSASRWFLTHQIDH
jgi:hypothetical protein